MKDDSKPLALDDVQKIDSACDQFEQDWKSGKNPRIEDYLATAEKNHTEELLRSLLQVELELLRREGQEVTAASLAARFSDYADIVAGVLESLPEDHRDSNSPAAHEFRQSRTLSLRDASIDTSQLDKTVGQGKLKATPKKLGRFEIVAILGEGAFGTVYRARDPQLHREVALKVPRAGVLETKDDVERFLQEARAAATLRHPHICPIYDFGKIDDDYFIVMAYIAGKPLSSVLTKSKKITNRKIAAAVRKIALALEEAHRHGVVHRDLKPSNIMIDKNGEPVVMDFGLARRVSEDEAQLTHSGAILGTPAYMPPEQARGESKEVGPASDVYSLGVILYELLCEQRPFRGAVAEVMAKILYEEPPPPSAHKPQVDSQLESICLKAMAKKRADRYQSMADFSEALTDYLRVQREGKEGSQSDSHEIGVLKSLAESGPLPVQPSVPAPPVRRSVRPKKTGFDPHHKWLGIPPEEQPPHHYRLLGLNAFEDDLDVIDAAAERQMSYLHQITDGPHVGDAQRLLNELAAARLCLLNAEKKAAYDAQLQTQLGSALPAAPKIPEPEFDYADVDYEEFQPLPERAAKSIQRAPWWTRFDRKQTLIAIGSFLVLLGVVIVIKTRSGSVTITSDESDVIVNSDEITGKHSVTAGDLEVRVTGKTPAEDVNYALKFDGKNSYVEIPSLKYDGNHPITVEALITPTAAALDSSQLTLIVGDCDFKQGFGLGTSKNGFLRAAMFGMGSKEFRFTDSDRSLSADSTVHVALVFDQPRLRIFVNGKLQQNEQMIWRYRKSLFPLRIGRGWVAKEDRLSFQGVIDEVRVSQKALYTSDYTPQDRLEASSDTLALYHFDEGSGSELKDASGNGHHGKIVGASWVPVIQPSSDSAPSGHTLLVYDATENRLPQFPVWVFQNQQIGGGTARVESGELVHDAKGKARSYWTSELPAPGVETDAALFMESTVQVIQEKNEWTQLGVTLLELGRKKADEITSIRLFGQEDRIFLMDRNNDIIARVVMDTTDAFHTYRLELDGNKLRLFVDGKLKDETSSVHILAATRTFEPQSQIFAKFGDESQQWSESLTHWKRVVVGAIEPFNSRSPSNQADTSPSVKTPSPELLKKQHTTINPSVLNYDAATGKLPQDIGWTYEQSNLGESTARNESGVLRHQSNWKDYSFWTATLPVETASAGAGLFMESTFKLIRENHDPNRDRGINLLEASDVTPTHVRGVHVMAHADKIFLHDGDDKPLGTIPMDTTDRFHNYRLEINGDKFWLFVDGELGLTKPLPAIPVSTTNRPPRAHLWAKFGDGSAFSGSVSEVKAVVFGSLTALGGPTSARKSTDYDHLLTGYWEPIAFPDAEGELTIQNGVPTFRPKGHVQLGNRKYRDLIIRAEVKKHKGWHPSMTVRKNESGNYQTYFDKFNRFGIGKHASGPWEDLQVKFTDQEYHDFFEWTVAAVGDRLTVYVEGKKVLDVRDTSHSEGFVQIGLLQSKSDFRNVQIMDLTNGPVRPQTNASATSASRVDFRNLRIRELNTDAAAETDSHAPDYAQLAMGKWLPLVRTKEDFASMRVSRNGIGVTDSSNENFSGGVLELSQDTVHGLLESVSGRDMIIRARVQRVGDSGNIGFSLRNSNPELQDGAHYVAWMMGKGRFCLGGYRTPSFAEIAQKKSLAGDYQDFFEIAFAAVGNKLTLYLNGRQILEAEDNSLSHGFPTLLANGCRARFREIEYQLLDAAEQQSSQLSAAVPTARELATNPDRAVAQWALDIGGEIEIRTGSSNRVTLKADSPIPPGPFELISLKFSENPQINDDVLQYLKPLKHLEHLDLNDVKIGDQGMQHLAGLRTLLRLYLSRTDITDDGVAALSRLQELRQFHVSGTKVTDRALPIVRSFENLTHLRLGWTAVSEDGIISLVRLTKLESLFLEKTPLSDRGLATLQKLVNLQELSIRVTQVTPAGVEKFQAAVPDCRVIGAGARKRSNPNASEPLQALGEQIRAIKDLLAAERDNGKFGQPPNVDEMQEFAQKEVARRKQSGLINPAVSINFIINNKGKIAGTTFGGGGGGGFGGGGISGGGAK